MRSACAGICATIRVLSASLPATRISQLPDRSFRRLIGQYPDRLFLSARATILARSDGRPSRLQPLISAALKRACGSHGNRRALLACGGSSPVQKRKLKLSSRRLKPLGRWVASKRKQQPSSSQPSDKYAHHYEYQHAIGGAQLENGSSDCSGVCGRGDPHCPRPSKNSLPRPAVPGPAPAGLRAEP
jgi:hypothetical protein